jgi:hypothetical protein
MLDLDLCRYFFFFIIKNQKEKRKRKGGDQNDQETVPLLLAKRGRSLFELIAIWG